MTRDEITKAADKFFEWPTDKHDTVTLTSCIFFAEEMVRKSKEVAWISTKDRTPTMVQEDHVDHIHCWCAIRWRAESPLRVEHLAWNPYNLCWDSEDEYNVSPFDSLVEFWQPFDIPVAPRDKP